MEETNSKLHLQSSPCYLNKKIRSVLFDFLKLSVFFLFFSIEACLILGKWKPIFHLLPFFSLLSFLAFDSLSKRTSIYVVDFSCLRPPKICRVPIATFLENASLVNIFDEDGLDFMAKVMYSSGQSEETYLPKSLHYIPAKAQFRDCINEAEMLLFPVMDDLLTKTQISPLDVDILVLNCSGFCPTPSLTSIIVNRYAMRSDIKSFNLSGMGCSAGAIGIDVAQNLFKVHKNSYAIVLSAEILSTGWYAGKDRRKLLLNCLFRMGSSAVLLTNRKEAKDRSKYKMVYKVRSNTSANDLAYHAGFREEDSEGITGFTLNRNSLEAAAESIRDNIVALGATILPPLEKLRYLISLLKREAYVPDFGKVIQHYCIPAAGKPLIKEIGKRLGLKEVDTEAAVSTLHRFGNQSSSSMWYEVAYMEAKGRMKKGDRLWQLWSGTGPKCTSIVWETLRNLEDEAGKGPWFDCIDRYPLSSFE